MSITPQHGDFRLVSNRVMNQLNNFNESDIYLRSIIPQLTNKIDYVHYKRAARKAGESKYTLLKMIRLARQSIFAQTNALLIGIGIMIIIYSLLSIIILAWVLVNLALGVKSLDGRNTNHHFYHINSHINYSVYDGRIHDTDVTRYQEMA